MVVKIKWFKQILKTKNNAIYGDGWEVGSTAALDDTTEIETSMVAVLGILCHCRRVNIHVFFPRSVQQGKDIYFEPPWRDESSRRNHCPDKGHQLQEGCGSHETLHTR